MRYYIQYMKSRVAMSISLFFFFLVLSQPTAQSHLI